MNGVIPTFATKLTAHQRDIRLLQRSVARLARKLGLEPDAGNDLGPGGAQWRELASQEDWAYVRLTASLGSASYTAARMQFDGVSASGLVDEDELTATFTVYAAPGTAPFVGAQGLVRFCGLTTGNAPVWITCGAGHWTGFGAKLTGAVDGSESYAWEEIGVPAWRTALTNTSTGVRAYDYAEDAYEAAVTVRNSYPTNQVVFLRHDANNSRMFFYGGREGDTELCS